MLVFSPVVKIALSNLSQFNFFVGEEDSSSSHANSFHRLAMTTKVSYTRCLRRRLKRIKPSMPMLSNRTLDGSGTGTFTL